MIRFLFRVLATLTLAGAVILALLDATRSVAASSLVTTPLIESWATALPGSLEAMRTFLVTKVGAFAWEPVMASILSLPGFVVFGALALLFYAIGYRRNPYERAWGR